MLRAVHRTVFIIPSAAYSNKFIKNTPSRAGSSLGFAFRVWFSHALSRLLVERGFGP